MPVLLAPFYVRAVLTAGRLPTSAWDFGLCALYFPAHASTLQWLLHYRTTVIQHQLDIRSAMSPLCLTMFPHSTGLLAPLAAGSAVILPAGGKFSAQVFWKDCCEHQATFYTAVPTIHQVLTSVPSRCLQQAAGHSACTGSNECRC